MRVLVARQEAARRLNPAAPPPPVMVLAPRPVLAWLKEFREVDPEVTWGGGDGGVAGAWAEDPYLVDVERWVVVGAGLCMRVTMACSPSILRHDDLSTVSLFSLSSSLD